jgi:hypothetical protein
LGAKYNALLKSVYEEGGTSLKCLLWEVFGKRSAGPCDYQMVKDLLIFGKIVKETRKRRVFIEPVISEPTEEQLSWRAFASKQNGSED